MGEPKWKQHWPEFQVAMTRRLDAGNRTYGDASFEKSGAELCGEMEEEALDIIGWGFLEWVKIRELHSKIAALEAKTSGNANT